MRQDGDLFDMRYWELEQIKFRLSGARLPSSPAKAGHRGGTGPSG
ncbi:hypothetical protein AB0I60_26915 [Actinosynnema sp. NPDC050436]